MTLANQVIKPKRSRTHVMPGAPGETIEIIMNHADAFQDLKEYLSEQGIGFREIYDGEQMTLQFTINGKF